ncbi:MAG: hypothetical protein P8X55_21640, partial [Desulfosarcinaceae bacterium]
MENKARMRKQLKWSGIPVLVLGCLLVLFGAPAAWALGTASGTSISNQATVDYQVGGVDQTQILSDDPAVAGNQATTFVVDRMVDLTVAEADGGYTNVSPGATTQVIT